MTRTDELQALVRATIDDPALSERQRVYRLAALAENSLDPPPVSNACRDALEARVICDMYEGHAPYRPRYVLPDYERAISRGSAHLELPPPTDLDDALWFLASMYTDVPSITGYPVYLGDLDRVLAPFVNGMATEEIVRRLRPFWRALDRMLPDAFVHTDLGPQDSPFLRAVLQLERELHQVVPNITLRVDPSLTPDDLVLDAVRTVFECAKPHVVNHPLMVSDLGERYAAVSCYNSLRIGGGSHTLTRVNLREAAVRHDGGVDTFLSHTLANVVELNAELMESRIRHLVETARFYDHSWLVDEGLVSLDRFTAMFGLFGLAEAVDLLMHREGSSGRYEHDAEANALALRITTAVSEQVVARPQPYCDGTGGHALLHSQSGIDSDVGITAGTRLPIGTEPPLAEHLMAVAPHHVLFPAGISDILHVDDTVRRNPHAMVDIIRGAFSCHTPMRDFTFNLDSNDFIRITGYLVRKSDLAHVAEGARHSSTFLGATNEAQAHCSERAVKRVVAAERRA